MRYVAQTSYLDGFDVWFNQVIDTETNTVAAGDQGSAAMAQHVADTLNSLHTNS